MTIVLRTQDNNSYKINLQQNPSNDSIDQSIYLSRNAINTEHGHQRRMQRPLTGARKNNVSKYNK